MSEVVPMDESETCDCGFDGEHTPECQVSLARQARAAREYENMRPQMKDVPWGPDTHAEDQVLGSDREL